MDQETNIQTGTTVAGPETMTPAHVETLDRLERVVVMLERLIESRSPEVLQQPGQDGRWGVIEVLCHLRDWEEIIHERIEQILEGERPEFDEPDVSLWPIENEYGSQNSQEVFAHLAGMRRELIDRLRGIDAEAWDRTGVLDSTGEITLRDFLERVIEHDERSLEEAREAVA